MKKYKSKKDMGCTVGTTDRQLGFMKNRLMVQNSRCCPVLQASGEGGGTVAVTSSPKLTVISKCHQHANKVNVTYSGSHPNIESWLTIVGMCMLT